MNIVVGLGSIDDYIPFSKAGADEFFIGYVPEWWTSSYGIITPLNRREVLFYNVQIGSQSEMEILREMVSFYQKPVSITLNALYYLPEHYPLLKRYIEECLSLGFDSFIIADHALLVYIKQTELYPKIKITISGELSEINAAVFETIESAQIKRIIFHRKMSAAEMKACILKSKTLEYEAFVLNEKCHFHGAFCQSLHCDELPHICKLPYRTGPFQTAEQDIDVVFPTSEQRSREYDCPSEYDYPSKCDYPSECDRPSEYDFPSERNIVGSTGCGLCALWELQDAHITHLKLVGRGNHTEDMLTDIKALKQALQILKNSSSSMEYISRMKTSIFPNGCSNNCYY